MVKALTAYRYASQKKNFPFEIKKTVSLELWADLNRRPHPYQLVRSHPGLGFQGFPPFLLQKGEVSDTLISLVSVRSFSRVGQAAIPVCWIVCRKALSSSAAFNSIVVHGARQFPWQRHHIQIIAGDFVHHNGNLTAFCSSPLCVGTIEKWNSRP